MGSPKDETTQDLERCGMDVRPDTQGGQCFWVSPVAIERIKSVENLRVYTVINCAYYCHYDI